jgi:hypothetical protein
MFATEPTACRRRVIMRYFDKPNKAAPLKDVILMSHATFGVFALLATVWMVVETFNGGVPAVRRAGMASVAVAALLWLAYLFGGYWYVNFYAPDKALILGGPMPFAHNLVMETKEHLFFILLLLGSFVPIAALDREARATPAGRTLVLVIGGLIVLLGLAMEGGGALIGLGVKEALLAR